MECRACDLYQEATQTVFGVGPLRSRLFFVGETPGDQEDRRGVPFVGPAGRVLDRAFADLGIDRKDVYLTNAVKHFRFERAERGKRRLHKTPNRTEIMACRPWVSAELSVVRPRLVVCLGAVAAHAIFGPGFRVTKERGRVVDFPTELQLPGRLAARMRAMATVHPSAVLRADNREAEYAAFRRDLEVAVAELAEG